MKRAAEWHRVRPRCEAVEDSWAPVPKPQKVVCLQWSFPPQLENGKRRCWLCETAAVVLAGLEGPRGQGVASHPGFPGAPGLET